MRVSQQYYRIFLINVAYISSIIYVPFTIANNAVTNKLFPALILLYLYFNLRNEIKLKHIKNFFIVFPLSISFLISSGSFISLAYTMVFVTLILYVIPYYVLLNLYGESFLNKHLLFIILISLIAVGFAWIEYLNPGIVNSLFFLRGSIYSGKGQVSSIFSNPNVFGLMTAFSFQAVLTYYKKNIFKILILFGILLSGILISESRMALAIIILLATLKIIPLIKISQSLFVICGVLVIFYISINFELIGTFINLNLRNEIWEGALVAFQNNYIFGIGLGQFEQDIGFYVSGYEAQSPNNLFIGLLSEVGLAGFLLFFYFVFKPLFLPKKKNLNKHFYLNSSIMLLVLLISQFSEYMLLYVGPYVLMLVLCVSMMHWSKK